MSASADLAMGGAVLAGGGSRRMGRDKVWLSVGSQPMWQRQLNVLLAAGASPVGIVRRKGQPPLSPGVPHWTDSMSDVGPLAGIHAALVSAGTPLVAVLAVDMPLIDADWFIRLRASCSPGTGAVAAHPSGSEPLAAIYPQTALPTVSAHLAERRHSLRDLVTALAQLGQMTLVPLSDEDRTRLTNWNTPADLPAKNHGGFEANTISPL